MFSGWCYLPGMSAADAPDPSETIPLRLRWRQTWLDRENDFAAEATAYKGSVGRIYQHDHGPTAGKWFWAFNAFGDDISRNIGAVSGYADSARLAAKAVEDCWFAAIKGSRLDVPEPQGNAYAAAKAR